MATTDEVLRSLLGNTDQFTNALAGPDFNQAFEQAMRDIARSKTGLNSLQSQQTERFNQDYSQGLQSLDRNKTDTLAALRDRLASQGILRSGINVDEQGKVQQNYLENLQGLTNTKTRGLEDLNVSVTNALQDLLSKEESLNFQRNSANVQSGLASAQEQAGLQALQSGAGGIGPSFSPTGQYTGLQGAAQRRITAPKAAGPKTHAETPTDPYLKRGGRAY